MTLFASCAKPSMIEKLTLDTCAALTIRVERAACNPGTTGDELCKLMAARRYALVTLKDVSAKRRNPA